MPIKYIFKAGGLLSMDYVIKTIPVKKLLVNPNNARFFTKETDSTNEIEGILGLIEEDRNHVLNLCEDISKQGLMPNQIPVAMPIKGSDQYMMYDGNRRLTSIKLMTQYKNNLEDFGFKSSEAKKISSWSTNIKSIKCIIPENIADVNTMLFRSHAAAAGVGQVQWRGFARAKHVRNAGGKLVEVLAFTHLLTYLNDNSEIVSDIISKGDIDRKLSSFTNQKSFMLILGLEFDENKNIKCYYDKQDIKRLITKLFIDVDKYTATEIIQPKVQKQKYIAKFITENNIDKIKASTRVQIFSPYIGEFIAEVSKDIVPKEKIKNTISEHLQFAISDVATSTDKPIVLDENHADTNSSTKDVDTKEVTATKKSDTLSATAASATTTSNTRPKVDKKPSPFFATLTRSKVDTSVDNLPLITICDEIVRFSKEKVRDDYLYTIYPVTATILLRVLVGQSLKYLLRKRMHDKLTKQNNGTPRMEDPALSYIVKTVLDNRVIIFQNRTVSRAYNALFKDDSFKDALDLAVHHVRSSSTNQLDAFAVQFLPIAIYVLNTVWNETTPTNP